MPCYQVIGIVNDWEYDRRIDAQEQMPQTNPVFATLEGAKKFCEADFEKWLEHTDPDGEIYSFSLQILTWKEDHGKWTASVDDSDINDEEWSAHITECKFLDTET